MLHRVSPHDQSDQVLKTYGFSPVSEDFLSRSRSSGSGSPRSPRSPGSGSPGCMAPPQWTPPAAAPWRHPRSPRSRRRRGGWWRYESWRQIPGQTMAKAMASSVKISGFQMGLWMFNDVYLHIWVYNVYIYIWVYICVTWA